MATAFQAVVVDGPGHTGANAVVSAPRGSWSVLSNVQLVSPVGVRDLVPEGYLDGGSLMHCRQSGGTHARQW